MRSILVPFFSHTHTPAHPQLVIGASILANNVVQLGGPLHDQNAFSMYMMGPFVGVLSLIHI